MSLDVPEEFTKTTERGDKDYAVSLEAEFNKKCNSFKQDYTKFTNDFLSTDMFPTCTRTKRTDNGIDVFHTTTTYYLLRIDDQYKLLDHVPDSTLVSIFYPKTQYDTELITIAPLKFSPKDYIKTKKEYDFVEITDVNVFRANCLKLNEIHDYFDFSRSSSPSSRPSVPVNPFDTEIDAYAPDSYISEQFCEVNSQNQVGGSMLNANDFTIYYNNHTGKASLVAEYDLFFVNNYQKLITKSFKELEPVHTNLNFENYEQINRHFSCSVFEGPLAVKEYVDNNRNGKPTEPEVYRFITGKYRRTSKPYSLKFSELHAEIAREFNINNKYSDQLKNYIATTMIQIGVEKCYQDGEMYWRGITPANGNDSSDSSSGSQAENEAENEDEHEHVVQNPYDYYCDYRENQPIARYEPEEWIIQADSYGKPPTPLYHDNQSSRIEMWSPYCNYSPVADNDEEEEESLQQPVSYPDPDNPLTWSTASGKGAAPAVEVKSFLTDSFCEKYFNPPSPPSNQETQDEFQQNCNSLYELLMRRNCDLSINGAGPSGAASSANDGELTPLTTLSEDESTSSTTNSWEEIHLE